VVPRPTGAAPPLSLAARVAVVAAGAATGFLMVAALSALLELGGAAASARLAGLALLVTAGAAAWARSSVRRARRPRGRLRAVRPPLDTPR
jgi:hypothetical protein